MFRFPWSRDIFLRCDRVPTRRSVPRSAVHGPDFGRACGCRVPIGLLEAGWAAFSLLRLEESYAFLRHAVQREIAFQMLLNVLHFSLRKFVYLVASCTTPMVAAERAPGSAAGGWRISHFKKMRVRLRGIC